MSIVRAQNPLWYYVDLDGNQFDDNFYMWVVENEIPYQPENIYQDENKTSRTNPVQFEANGTLPLDVYFDDTKTYRLEFRENDGTGSPSQSDPLIYLFENYNPLGDVQDEGQLDSALVTNQITNPQFAQYNLGSDTLTLTSVSNPDPIEVAPGWHLVLQGTGSVDIERVALTSTTAIDTNAPYALRLNLSGSWTSVVLRQRLKQNGRLWSESFVSGALTARIDGGDQQVTVRLDDSMGAPLGILVQDTIVSTFGEYSGNVELPITSNTDTPPDAYLDYKVILPTTGDIYLTSFSLVPTGDNDVIYPFGQTTVNRQIDQTFNYHKEHLEYKPIPSHLVGWDFPRNPAQWGDTFSAAAIGANKSDYVWDQTIVFQTKDSGFNVSRDNNGSLKLEIEVDDTQVALVQYIESDVAKSLLNDRMSVNVSAVKADGGTVNGVVSIWYTDDPSLPDITSGTNNSIVATLNADGTLNTRNGSWTEVPRRGTEEAKFTIEASTTNNPNDYHLNGWDLEGDSDIDSVTFVAIVVSFESMDDGEIVDFHSISLNSGDISTRPAPMSIAQTRLSCQRYYWKSFKPDTVPAQNAGAGTTSYAWDLLTTGAADQNILSIQNPAVMYKVPSITLYNPAAANSNVYNDTKGGDATSSTTTLINEVGFVITAADTAGSLGNTLIVHFTADARLGT